MSVSRGEDRNAFLQYSKSAFENPALGVSLWGTRKHLTEACGEHKNTSPDCRVLKTIHKNPASLTLISFDQCFCFHLSALPDYTATSVSKLLLSSGFTVTIVITFFFSFVSIILHFPKTELNYLF